jgi:hypothetical protein
MDLFENFVDFEGSSGFDETRAHFVKQNLPSEIPLC